MRVVGGWLGEEGGGRFRGEPVEDDERRRSEEEKRRPTAKKKKYREAAGRRRSGWCRDRRCALRRGRARASSRLRFALRGKAPRTLTGSMSGRPLFATYAPAPASAASASRPTTRCTRDLAFFFSGFPSRRFARPTWTDVAMSFPPAISAAPFLIRATAPKRTRRARRRRGPARGEAAPKPRGRDCGEAWRNHGKYVWK